MLEVEDLDEGANLQIRPVDAIDRRSKAQATIEGAALGNVTGLIVPEPIITPDERARVLAKMTTRYSGREVLMRVPSVEAK